ncbi:MAG: aldo/keto reductase [Steroidobacteraceae bacterium]
MLNRRHCIQLALGAGAAFTINPRLLFAAQQAIIQRAIPSTGEKLPVMGLGSAATFRQAASSEDTTNLKAVLQTMMDNGGRVLDTAPSYGASEQVSGEIAKELGLTSRIFWATKVNVAGNSGGSANPIAARAQIENLIQNTWRR